MAFTRGGRGRLSRFVPDEIVVLLVDDEPGFAEMVGEHLEREKEAITATSATSVAEGTARLREAPVDVVVSDYEMPGEDGLAFLDGVREAHPGLPFILFTGRGSEEIASEAISRGVTDYLQKGSRETYELLANRIEHAAARARAEQAADERERRLLRGSSAAPPTSSPSSIASASSSTPAPPSSGSWATSPTSWSATTSSTTSTPTTATG